MVKSFTSVVEWLSGKKTYFLGLIALLVLVAEYLQFLTPEVTNEILKALGVLSVFTVRSAIASLR